MKTVFLRVRDPKVIRNIAQANRAGVRMFHCPRLGYWVVIIEPLAP